MSDNLESSIKARLKGNLKIGPDVVFRNVRFTEITVLPPEEGRYLFDSCDFDGCDLSALDLSNFSHCRIFHSVTPYGGTLGNGMYLSGLRMGGE